MWALFFHHNSQHTVITISMQNLKKSDVVTLFSKFILEIKLKRGFPVFHFDMRVSVDLINTKVDCGGTQWENKADLWGIIGSKVSFWSSLPFFNL